MPEVLDKETIKALSTDTRQEIVKLLAKRPYTASEIAKITKKHVTTVTEHLAVLEKAGLVKKKERKNKWVYYELTDKGDHLFRPQFYSFVVVLSLSLVLMFVGFLRVFNFQNIFTAASKVAAPEAASQIAGRAGDAARTYAAPFDYTGLVLIIIGALGMGYLAYRKHRK